MEIFRKSKAGKMDAIGIVLVIAAIALVLQSGALSNFLPSTPQSTGGGAGGGGTAPTNTVTVVGAQCALVTTLTASVVRRYTEVAQTAQNITILQNGVLKGTIAHQSTTTVQSGANGDTLDLFPGLQSTTFYARHLAGKISTCTGSATTGDAQYFSEVNDATVGGAKVTYTDATGLFTPSPNKLLQIDTAPTITVINPSQSNSQSASNANDVSGGTNLTIGAGGTGTVHVTIQPTINTGFGPNGNIMACQFPSAIYDSVNPIIPSVTGSGQLEATDTKPSLIVYQLIAANSTVRAWKFPGIDGRKTTQIDMDVKLYADPSRNPAGLTDRVNCTLFDTSYYQKQKDGAYVLDIENRDTSIDLGGVNTPYSFVIGVA